MESSPAERLRDDLEIALDRLNFGGIDIDGFVVDVQIANLNFEIRSQPPSGIHQIGENKISVELGKAFSTLADRFPSTRMDCKLKTYLRDWTTFSTISKIEIAEYGLIENTSASRIVPREFRTRRTVNGRELSALKYAASFAEIRRYCSSLPGYGSPKTLERQYINARDRISEFVFPDTEKNELVRDNLYHRVCVLRQAKK